MVGGRGPIEHFVLRMPAYDDRQSLEETPTAWPPACHETERALVFDWGCRVPLTEASYQNRWLFGVDRARFYSDHICLAYLGFPTEQSVSSDPHPHRLHLHQRSWEYYTVLRGVRTLEVEEELVQVHEGEILEVPPGARHVLQATRPPFEGFTIRVPRLDDKIVF